MDNKNYDKLNNDDDSLDLYLNKSLEKFENNFEWSSLFLSGIFIYLGLTFFCLYF